MNENYFHESPDSRIVYLGKKSEFNATYVQFSLQSFQTIDDLDGMWNVMRSALSRRVGKSHLICLPHITDGYSYTVGSVLVRKEKKGCLCTKRRTFLPLGPLENFTNKEKTKDYWNTRQPLLFSKSSTIGLRGCYKLSKGDAVMDEGFTRAGFTIILEDVMGHKELKLNVESIYTRSLAPGINPVGTVVFDRSKHPELVNAKEIYLVTNVKEVDRLELAGVIGTRARVFHIINRYPLYFTYQKYKIDENGRITAKIRGDPSEKRTNWIRTNNTDRLDDIPPADLKTSKEDNGNINSQFV